MSEAAQTWGHMLQATGSKGEAMAGFFFENPAGRILVKLIDSGYDRSSLQSACHKTTPLDPDLTQPQNGAVSAPQPPTKRNYSCHGLYMQKNTYEYANI